MIQSDLTPMSYNITSYSTNVYVNYSESFQFCTINNRMVKKYFITNLLQVFPEGVHVSPINPLYYFLLILFIFIIYFIILTPISRNRHDNYRHFICSKRKKYLRNTLRTLLDVKLGLGKKYCKQIFIVFESIITALCSITIAETIFMFSCNVLRV